MTLGGCGWRGAGACSGSRPTPGSGSRGAARWSLVFPGDEPCAVAAVRRDTISSLLVEQNTETWCVCSCVTLLSAGTRAAQLAPQGSPRSTLPGVVPLAYVAGLGAGQQLWALPCPCQPTSKPIKLKAAASSLQRALETVRCFHAGAHPDLFQGHCQLVHALNGGLKAWHPPLKLTCDITLLEECPAGGQGLPTPSQARQCFGMGQ